MSSEFVHGIAVRVVPKLLSWVMRVWFGSCRVKLHNGTVMQSSPDEGPNIVASFWHYSIIFILYMVRKYPATVMVSASRDGEYIARLAEEFGFRPVRGSRNNKGVEALKGMLRGVKQGDSGAVVADGSQGPPRVAQPGALLVAAKTGRPIVPIVWSASSYYTINSWDKTAVPKPFSRVDVFFGEPLYIPRTLSAEELESYRCILENQLNELYSKAWSQHGKSAHY